MDHIMYNPFYSSFVSFLSGIYLFQNNNNPENQPYFAPLKTQVVHMPGIQH